MTILQLIKELENLGVKPDEKVILTFSNGKHYELTSVNYQCIDAEVYVELS